MGETYIYDISNATDFEVRVIEASRELPVAVLFGSKNSGPCRLLTPLLEQVVRAQHGKMRLARVDIDASSNLADTWHIRCIPCVRFFRDGVTVQQFDGSPPASEVYRHVASCAPSEADQLALEGDRHNADRQLGPAEEKYRAALAIEANHTRACHKLSAILLMKGEHQHALDLINKARLQDDPHVERMKARLHFMKINRDAGGLAAAETAAAESPNSDELKLIYGSCLAAEERYPKAMEVFLEIVKAGGIGGDIAHDAIKDILRVIGKKSLMAKPYRDRLNRLLYPSVEA